MIQRVALEAPAGWTVSEYREIASLRSTNPVSPELRLRFEADMRANVDMFAPLDLQIGETLPMIQTKSAGEEMTLFGTTVLTYRAGSWSGDFNFENDPRLIGQPLGAPSHPSTISQGAAYEQISIALNELEVSAEAKSAVPRLRAELAEAKARAKQRVEDARSLEERLAAALAARMDDRATIKETRQKLASALAALRAAETRAADRLDEAERRAGLLAHAREMVAQSDSRADEAERQAELLNQQVGALRQQVRDLQALLAESREQDEAAQVQLQNLGSELNAALARVAAEERRRRLLEEAEARDLERYRSEFFGRLRDVIAETDGVRIEGDRFVFSSEVLFGVGSADLSTEGQAELENIAGILRSIADDIPPEIDWVIRVDGHTDNIPVRSSFRFEDNWELSQTRALSVVRHMIDGLGIPPDLLAANGFGQYQPINPADTPEARAQNRRIEMKLTER